MTLLLGRDEMDGMNPNGERLGALGKGNEEGRRRRRRVGEKEWTS